MARSQSLAPDALPHSTMSDATFRLFAEGIESTPTTRGRPAFVSTNLTLLQVLRAASWPAVESMQRVRFQERFPDRGGEGRWRAAWQWTQPDKPTLLLRDNFAVQPVNASLLTNLQGCDYRLELAELIQYVQGTNEFSPTFNFEPIRSSNSYAGSVELLHHAYAAATLKFTNEASALLRAAFAKSRAVLIDAGVDGLRKSHLRARELLSSGAPWSDVLAQWEYTLQVYRPILPPTNAIDRRELVWLPSTELLQDYTNQLRRQVSDFPGITARTIENPETLRTEERAAYYLDRFPELAGPTERDLSFRSTERAGSLDDRVVRIGRPAIPQLIEHLTDRRITRRVPRAGISDLGSGDAPIPRVQDLSLECLERIANVRFHPQRSEARALSMESPSTRENDIAAIRRWWATFHDKPMVDAQFAQLEQLPIDERLRELGRLEREGLAVAMVVPTLKEWAARTNRYAFTQLARALEERKDLSWLPRAREQLRSGDANPTELMLRHGNIDDYAFIQEEVRRERTGARNRGMGYSFQLSLTLHNDMVREETPGPAMVPLLADGLNARVLEPHHFEAPTDELPWSDADQSMQWLIRLVGHNEGWEKSAAPTNRFAAIDRWEGWWTRTGRAEFVAQHPETQRLLQGYDPAPVDDAHLPALARVDGADPSHPIYYEVPRVELVELLRHKAVVARQTWGTNQFRFASTDAAQRWFTKVRPVTLRPDTPEGQQLLRAETDESDAPKNAGTRASRPRTRGMAARNRPDLSDPRLSAMIVSIDGETWLDGRGRMWMMWASAGQRQPACLDRGGWQSFSIANRRSPERSREASEPRVEKFVAAFPGPRGAMLFEDDGGHMNLFDEDGWAWAPTMNDLATAFPSRVRARISPRQVDHEIPFYHAQIVKDSNGNTWWWEPQNGGGVLTAADGVVRFRAKPGERGEPRFEPAMLAPLNRKAGVLAIGRQGELRIFELREQSVTEVTNTRLPGLRLAGVQAQRSYWLDRKARVWIPAANETLALDGNAGVSATEPGRLVVADAKGGYWFKDQRGSSHFLTRVAPDGRRTSVPLESPDARFAAAPDGTVWMGTSKGLTLLSPRSGEIRAEERYFVSVGSTDQLACDGEGRVWHRRFGRGTFTQEAACYAIRR